MPEATSMPALFSGVSQHSLFLSYLELVFRQGQVKENGHMV